MERPPERLVRKVRIKWSKASCTRFPHRAAGLPHTHTHTYIVATFVVISWSNIFTGVQLSGVNVLNGALWFSCWGGKQAPTHLLWFCCPSTLLG